mmetsp:Transcript_12534/g.24991  ORF Transcript_12534/g.24991 Transcript_12534/m.24991 type:complete len:139 (-) Transcript_12534:133-549(-)
MESRFIPYFGPNTLDYRIGAVACALSHVTLLERIVALNIPAAIVLEDDAELGSDFVTAYAAFRRDLPTDFDVCQLFHHMLMAGLRGRAEYEISGNEHVMQSVFIPQPARRGGCSWNFLPFLGSSFSAIADKGRKEARF